ncbi:MAG: hypothetical protein L0Z62_24765 [Gemmataceae bacterium]|nr:hypothetical protein [Gemmataceae bacterium]
MSPDNQSTILTYAGRWCRIKLGQEAALVHALRLRNLIHGYGTQNEKTFHEFLLRLILNDEEYRRWAPGFPMLYDTPYGATYRTMDRIGRGGRYVGGMTHVDKVLSALGELGFALTTELVTTSGRRPALADVLEDSLKRWHPERENEWTLLAYCAYLRTQTAWRAADGNQYAVDDVLKAVLKQKHPGPCFGAHRLYGLARASMRARETPGFFSADLIQEAEQVLKDASARLIRSQHPDGYWLPNWTGDPRPDSDNPEDATDPRVRVSVTGHMLEWFAIADPDLRPPGREIERAARYIERELLLDPERYFNSYLLPGATHAVRGLFHLCEPRGPQTVKESTR